MIAKIANRNFWPLLAYEGPQPVGMVEVSFARDPMTGEWTAFGDHLFVTKKARRRGVLKVLAEALQDIAEWNNADAGVMPADDDTKLDEFYRGYGFHRFAHMYRRQL